MSMGPELISLHSTGLSLVDCKKQHVIPKPVDGTERMILYRGGMGLKFKGHKNPVMKGVGSASLSGCTHLSTHRLVFIQDHTTKIFDHGNTENEIINPPQAVEIPHFLWKGESRDPPKFYQPIFGSTYLQGDLSPLTGAVHVSGPTLTGTLTLSFSSGGSGGFLQMFWRAWRLSREAMRLGLEKAERRLLQTTIPSEDDDDSPIYVPQQGFVPAGEPTHLYIAQPIFTKQ